MTGCSLSSLLAFLCLCYLFSLPVPNCPIFFICPVYLGQHFFFLVLKLLYLYGDLSYARNHKAISSNTNFYWTVHYHMLPPTQKEWLRVVFYCWFSLFNIRMHHTDHLSILYKAIFDRYILLLIFVSKFLFELINRIQCSAYWLASAVYTSSLCSHE